MRSIFRKALMATCSRTDTTILCRLHTKNSKEKPRHKVVSFFLTHYVNLVKSCEKTFPTAAKFYKTFKSGIKGFKNDSILLFQVYKKLSCSGIYCLTRKELEVYHQMPKNIVKLSPIIIGSALPFGVALFAIGCMFPRITLSHHFWSETQKNEFALIDHKKRLHHYGSIISCMQTKLKTIKCHTLQYELNSILVGLKSGITPTIEDILVCKPIFQESYSLQCLGPIYTSHLLKLHNLHRGWRRKRRLDEFAALLKAMDTAIVTEGGLCQLTPDELKWASFFRGLNPINMSSEEIISWLNNWLTISREIDENCHSLLLHCPVLLGYNQPTNVALIQHYRK